MEKLVLDLGIKEYQINDNAVLRFNPTDPNVYSRIMDAADKISSMEKEYMERVKSEEAKGKLDPGTILLEMLRDADKQAKNILSEAFGNGNDFDAIFDGVNIIAKRRKGGRVIDSFFEAIFPIVEQGVKDLIEEDTAAIEKYAADYN